MNLGRKIYYFLPPRLRIIARKLIYWPATILNKPVEFNGIQLPPKTLIFTGGGDFLEAGLKFLKLFKDDAGLQSSDSILDIGSGMGRMAIPLTSFIKPPGKYVGLELMEQGVSWCNQNIKSKFPHFSFKKAEVSNDLYSLSGIDAASYTFPFGDDEFSFVILISVFTHMLPDEVENYLKEMARIMRKNSKAVITFFIFEDKEILLKNNFENFNIQEDYYALMDQKVKSANVAYALPFLQTMISKFDFEIMAYHQGSWKNGDENLIDFQDILILNKLK